MGEFKRLAITSFVGGFTEINEQGGEIIDLQAGKLDNLIQSSNLEYSSALGNIETYSGMANNLSAFPQEIQNPELSAFPQAIDFEKMSAGFMSNSTSNTTTNTNNNGITITGNNFNIRKESDIDEIVFRLFNLLFDSNANFGGA